MSGVSDPFLWELRKLVAAFEEVEDRWTVFWSRYEEARKQRGVWFADLGPKWHGFQSAFREAAQQTVKCRQAMSRPEDLPRLFTGWPPGWAIADTFPALLKLFAEKFSAWLPGVMDPKGGFTEWNWNTDFSRDFMGQFRALFIVPLEEAIKVYERFLAQREAQRLAEALVSPEIAPQPPLAEPSAGAPSTGTVAPAGHGGDEKVAETIGDQRRPRKRRRLTGMTDGDEKVLAAILRHHNYPEYEPEPTPIGVRELARQAGVSKSQASQFFQKYFKPKTSRISGYRCYKLLCGKPADLLTKLRELCDELPSRRAEIDPENLPSSGGREIDLDEDYPSA